MKIEKILNYTAASFFILMVALYFQYTVDDAYITFRHSFNLVNHGVLSWNLSDPREEAFTNPIYVLFGAAGIYLDIKPEIPVKIIGLLLIIAWAIRIKTEYTRINNTDGSILVLIFLFCVPSYIHAFSGLETFFYAYALFEYLIAFERRSSNYKLGSIAAILFLLRPEGALFVLLAFCKAVYEFFHYRSISRENKNNLSHDYWSVVFYLIFLICFSIYSYKIYYFQDLFPNSFYVKSGGGASFEKIFSNFLSSLPWLIVFLVFSRMRRISLSNIVPLIPIFLIYVLYIKSDLLMNFASRFWYQIFWPIIIWQGLYNKSLSFKVFFNIEKINKFNLRFILTFFLLLFLSYKIIKPKEALNLLDETGRSLRSHANLGFYLNKHLPKDSIIYLGEAGFIPYYSERKTIDKFGLGTKEIALHGINIGFMEKINPDVLVLYNTNYPAGCAINGDLGSDKNRQSVELEFLNKGNHSYVGTLMGLKTHCLNVYANKRFEGIFKSSEFESLKYFSTINSNRDLREYSVNWMESYKYLIKPMGVYPANFGY
jgi:hypothetical protein